MASIKLEIDTTTEWADFVEEARKAPAAAGAGTPQKEKGWTDVNAPKGKKTKSRTKDTAPADAVAKTLDFGGQKPYADPNNKFAVLAWSDSE